MSAGAEPRPAFEMLRNAAGLALWAVHFGVIYAINALACERGLAGTRLLGLPWAPALIGLATLAALLPLGLVLWSAVSRLGQPLTEGGEAEPRFTRWFAAATAGYAILAVLFQAAPALLVPPCGPGH
jgi:hypothetical protein